jgi:aminopeptidase-like protein
VQIADLERTFDRLWPLCRSLTGRGFRDSLDILRDWIPLETISVRSGTKVFDWTVPDEWNPEDAFIEDSSGSKVVDFKKNNLHLVGYSTPYEGTLSLEELQPHLHSLPHQPQAIPYVTSYYKKHWGFCLRHDVRENLMPGNYKVVVKTKLEPGAMTLAHTLLPSTEGHSGEVLFSTYLCHPSMANNELSGPLALAALYHQLDAQKRRKLNYRFVIVPETIGSIAYLQKFGEHLRSSMIAGYVITCCADRGPFTYKKSRNGKTRADAAAESVLLEMGKSHSLVEFFPSGSDERQYCSPGFDLPVGSLMRTMYGKYPEYHTSLDNREFISFAALQETADVYFKIAQYLEQIPIYKTAVPFGEPMLGQRGLYPSLSAKEERAKKIDMMMWLINLSDGLNDIEMIAKRSGHSKKDLISIANELREKGLLNECD